jgi:hypothetical protein
MVLVQLLLPATAAPSGGDTAMLDLTRSELAKRFSGVMTYIGSPADGLWTAPDGHMEQDDVVMVEVVTPTFDRHWWRSYAAKLAGRFRQDAIHVRAVPVKAADDAEEAG